IGSAVNDLSLTSPRRPCAPPIWATQMRSATAGRPCLSASACPRAASSGRGLARSRGPGRLLRPRLSLLAGDRPGGGVALVPWHPPGLIKKAQAWVGRQRPLGEPRLRLVKIELEALGLVLGQQRIEIAEPLDEAAIARRAAVGNHDVIERALLRAGTGET